MKEKKDKEEEIKKGEQEPIDGLEGCKKEAQEYLNGWKRAKADLINYKRDEARRLEEILSISKMLFVKDFILILDSFNQALESFKKEGKDEKGVYMIYSQFKNILRKHGLEEIEVKAGDEFDPRFHEAVEEVESEADSGKIAEEIEKGYRLNNKVIRPVRVKISKQKSQ